MKKSKKPIVLLDSDGVKFNFIKGALKIIHQVTGIQHAEKEVKTWEIFDSLPYEASVKNRVYAKMRQPGFCRNLEVYEGAIEGVKRLHKIAEVYVVTSPFGGHPTWVNERAQALKEHFDIPSNRIVHTNAKHLVMGDVFVDDKPEHVKDWSKSNPKGLGLLWYMPYNATSRGTMRVRSWDKLLEIVASRD